MPTRRGMRKLLSSRGVIVTEADCLQRGFELLSNQDWLLCDLMLPDGLGLELMRHVRSLDVEMKIALVTATGDSKLIEEIHLFGPELYLRKPIDSNLLLNTICGG